MRTDAKEALHLARLLRLDEYPPVAIPTVDQEAARDLVRAREDCRGDLMSAQHRLSKLLLRHRIVYYGGNAWTGKHDMWLRTEALGQLRSRATRVAFDSAYETVLATKARRDRLDAVIEELAADSEFTPIVRRLGCLAGVGTLTGFALAVEIGDWHRFTGRHHWLASRPGPHRVLLRRHQEPGFDHQDWKRSSRTIRLAVPNPRISV